MYRPSHLVCPVPSEHTQYSLIEVNGSGSSSLQLMCRHGSSRQGIIAHGKGFYDNYYISEINFSLLWQVIFASYFFNFFFKTFVIGRQAIPLHGRDSIIALKVVGKGRCYTTPVNSFAVIFLAGRRLEGCY